MPEQRTELDLLIDKIATHLEYYIDYSLSFDETPAEFSTNDIIDKNIAHYIHRFVKYLKLNAEDLINFCFYFDKFLTMKPNYIISEYNIYMIIAGLIVLEQKFHEDSLYVFKYYADVASISVRQLKQVEYRLIKFWFSYDLMISPKEYLDCLNKIANPLLHEQSILNTNPQIHHNFTISDEQSISRKKTFFKPQEIEERTRLITIFQAQKNTTLKNILTNYDLTIEQIIVNSLHEIEMNVFCGFMDVSFIIEIKQKLLIFALEIENKQLTQWILDEGADPNYNPSKSEPAFWIAIKNDWQDVVDKMLSTKLFPDTLEQSILLIFYHFKLHNRLRYMSQIFAQYPTIDLNHFRVPNQGFTLHLAIQQKVPMEFIDLLCRNGADVTLENAAQKSPLLLTAETCQYQVFLCLLEPKFTHDSNSKLSDQQALEIIKVLLIANQDKLARCLLKSNLVSSEQNILNLAGKDKKNPATFTLLKTLIQAIYSNPNQQPPDISPESKSIFPQSFFPTMLKINKLNLGKSKSNNFGF